MLTYKNVEMYSIKYKNIIHVHPSPASVAFCCCCKSIILYQVLDAWELAQARLIELAQYQKAMPGDETDSPYHSSWAA